MKAPRILLYGPSKIGISSFCANIDNVYFLDLDDGIDHLDTHSHRCFNIQQCKWVINHLKTTTHNFKVLVIDTIDGLEVMLQDHVYLKEHQKTPTLEYFEDIPFGKGPGMVLNEFRDFLERLDNLRESRGMTILFTGHESVDTRHVSYSGAMSFSKPFMFTKTVKAQTLVEEASSILTNWVDFTGYVHQKNNIEGGFFSWNRRTVLNKSKQPRAIYTDRRPMFEAGSRYDLPYELPLEWKALNEHLAKVRANPIRKKEKRAFKKTDAPNIDNVIHLNPNNRPQDT